MTELLITPSIDQLARIIANVSNGGVSDPRGRQEMPWNRVLSFTDPVPCQAAIQACDVEILPTTRGSFHAEITQIGMNKLWMQRFDELLPQSSVAVNPSRKVIGFLADTNSSHLQHCGFFGNYRHPRCDRSRVLGAWTFLVHLPRAVCGIPIGDIEASS
jgi:hypothetical protein